MSANPVTPREKALEEALLFVAKWIWLRTERGDAFPSALGAAVKNALEVPDAAGRVALTPELREALRRAIGIEAANG